MKDDDVSCSLFTETNLIGGEAGRLSFTTDAASDGIDAVTKNDWGGAKKSGQDIANWSRQRFG